MTSVCFVTYSSHVRRIAAALCIAVIAGTAAAIPPPPPPAIHGITPRSGGAGTLITIDGELFLPYGGDPCATPDCSVTVSFGDVVVKAEEASYGRIVVHAPYTGIYGSSDVTVRSPRGVAFAKNGFRYSNSDFDSQWAAVLVPLWLDTPAPGARGSIWSTELWLRNGGDEPLTIVPWDCGNDPRFCRASRTLAPSESLRNLPLGPPRATNFHPNDAPFPPARVLYVSRDAAPSVQARLRLREMKSGVTTDLPVVREGETRTSVDLVGVPVATNARTTLRIYAVNFTFEVFDVYVFQQHEGTDDAVALAAMQVVASAPFSESAALTAYPAYAAVDLGPLLHNARDSVHIAIVPAFATIVPTSFWAMVSITENDTQRVTLATP
jgi:IPT/TIG domain